MLQRGRLQRHLVNSFGRPDAAECSTGATRHATREPWRC